MGKIKCTKLKCPQCNVTGLCQIFLNKDGRIRYARVRHYKGLNELKKPQFNYHKVEDLEALKTSVKSKGTIFSTDKAIGQAGQSQTANMHGPKLNNSSLKGFVEPPLGFEPRTFSLQETGNIDPKEFKQWLIAKEYSRSYINMTVSYANRFSYILETGNLRVLETFQDYKRANVVKALILLSKFFGTYTQFKAKLAEYGIKWHRPDSLGAFLRIFNASNNDIVKWYREAISKLRENEALFTKFLLHSGLRTSEAIHSFNLIIQLSRENNLSEYYDSELQVLCHFKYPKLFIRRTKNCYITFTQPEFLSEIAQSKPVTYSMIRKRLERKSIHLRFNELRDKFGTYLLSHRILEAEINLLQGRIPVDIFIRHYWNPKLKELGSRIFKALETMERDLVP